MIYLLDTDICIYIIKRKPANVFARFNELALGAVGISTITLAELEYGAAKSSQPERNKYALAHFLLPLEIVVFDDRAANEYGGIRSALEREGKPIGPLDTLIAAHAKSLGLTLVTNNEREFRRVKDLNLENWL